MEYQEAIRLLGDMKGRFNDGCSYSDRSIIEDLHQQVLNRIFVKTGCGDCYRDAYIQILSTLKRTKEMPTYKSLYILKAGALLRKAGSNKFYSNPLPSDDVAEEHLAENPSLIRLFASYPVDWEARVQARKNGSNLPETISAEVVSGYVKQLEEKDSVIANLLKENKEQSDSITTLRTNAEEMEKAISLLEAKVQEQQVPLSEENDSAIANLQMELDVCRADLKSANEEIEALRAANEALKANKTSRSTKKV